MKLFKMIAMVVALVGTAFSANAEGKDWQGWRAGLSLGVSSQTQSWHGSAYSDGSEAQQRLFAGYDWQKGRTVYGLELAIGRANESWEYLSWPSAANPEHGVGTTRTIDLKARLGRVFKDNWLGYGFVGVGTFDNTATATNNSFATYHSEGVTKQIGLGVEFRPGNHVFYGLELGYRAANIDFPAAKGVHNDGPFAALRVGWKF